MPSARKFSPDQWRYLESNLSEFLDYRAQKKKRVFLNKVEAEFAKRFPEIDELKKSRPDLFPANATVPSNNPALSGDGGDAQADDGLVPFVWTAEVESVYTEAVRARNSQIANWFTNHARDVIGRAKALESAISVLDDIVPKKRAPQRIEVYQRVFKDKIREAVEADKVLLPYPLQPGEIKPLPQDLAAFRQAARRRVVTAMYREESAENIALVEDRWRKECEDFAVQSAAAKITDAEAYGLERDPERRKQFIRTLIPKLEFLCKEIQRLCGWSSFFLIGGPNPLLDDRLFIHAISGAYKNAVGTFPDSCENYIENVAEPVTKWMQDIYEKELGMPNATPAGPSSSSALPNPPPCPATPERGALTHTDADLPELHSPSVQGVAFTTSNAASAASSNKPAPSLHGNWLDNFDVTSFLGPTHTENGMEIIRMDDDFFGPLGQPLNQQPGASGSAPRQSEAGPSARSMMSTTPLSTPPGNPPFMRLAALKRQVDVWGQRYADELPTPPPSSPTPIWPLTLPPPSPSFPESELPVSEWDPRLPPLFPAPPEDSSRPSSPARASSAALDDLTTSTLAPAERPARPSPPAPADLTTRISSPTRAGQPDPTSRTLAPAPAERPARPSPPAPADLTTRISSPTRAEQPTRASSPTPAQSPPVPHLPRINNIGSGFQLGKASLADAIQREKANAGGLAQDEVAPPSGAARGSTRGQRGARGTRGGRGRGGRGGARGGKRGSVQAQTDVRTDEAITLNSNEGGAAPPSEPSQMGTSGPENRFMTYTDPNDPDAVSLPGPALRSHVKAVNQAVSKPQRGRKRKADADPLRNPDGNHPLHVYVPPKDAINPSSVQQAMRRQSERTKKPKKAPGEMGW